MSFSGKHLALPGDRVILRTLEERDATERYVSWLNDSEVNRFLATKGATVETQRAYIAAKHAQSDTLFFGIFMKDTDLMIGTVKLEPIELEAKRATIAVMIGDKAYWGKGLASEAMRILCDWSFAQLRLEEVHLGVIAKNTAAIRAYEKAGFQELRRDPGAVRYGDELHDQVWMVLKRPV